MIAFEFDRAKMRTAYKHLLAVCLSVFLVVTVLGGLLLLHAAAIGWLKWAVRISILLILLQLLDFAPYGGVLHRGLRKRLPAVVINQIGIVDNSSQFALGQLEWDQIEKMYPYEIKSRLIINWWTKMPVIFRQRGVAIILKDSADLRPY